MFSEVTSSTAKSVDLLTNDVGRKQLYPAESRSENRKSVKSATASIKAFLYEDSTDDVGKMAVTVAYGNKTNVHVPKSRDSLPIQIRYFSMNATAEHVPVHAYNDVTTTTLSSGAAAVAMVNYVDNPEVTAVREQSVHTADGMLPSSTAVAVIGAAVVGVVAFWTIATLFLLVALYRRRYLRARDTVADRTIVKPMKSCTGLSASSTGNDVDGTPDRWTCSTKLLSDDGGPPDVDDDARLYAVRDNRFQLASSSSANLRWYHGSELSFPTSGSCAVRRDGRSSVETRYTILRSDTCVPNTFACDKHIDDGDYETLVMDASGNHVIQCGMVQTASDRLPTLPPPYVVKHNHVTVDGPITLRTAKRFPRMGCSSSTCAMRSPHIPCSRHWTQCQTGKSEDDSVLANSRHRYYNGVGGKQSAHARYAPLQRSDTTDPGLLYSNIGSTVL